MATNLALDEELINEAKRLGGHRTKREAVNQALAEYVAGRKRRKLLDLFGKCDWDPDYDYKAERKRR
jgi:Arc/MetJ family transcription regulator